MVKGFVAKSNSIGLIDGVSRVKFFGRNPLSRCLNQRRIPLFNCSNTANTTRRTLRFDRNASGI